MGMGTGFRGTFVISWEQVELDGLADAPLATLAIGAAWQWRGSAARVDGPSDVLLLGQDPATQQLRQHASQAAGRIIGRRDRMSARTERLPAPEDPLLDNGFSVTDGVHRYTATLIERIDGPPLCMFLDDLPPQGRELWVSHVVSGMTHPNRTGDRAPSVICFTPEAQIATPDGPRAAGDLAEGDVILTKDDGPQPVRWIGRRRMSGARLYTMPELRPIRIAARAFGEDRPDADLLVSPLHRLVMTGPMAQTLFNEAEVLVAARDLINDHSIQVDRRLREVTYIHLLLDRHSIVFANGIESETFHPASMEIAAVDVAQLQRLTDCVPGVDRDPSVYGAFARRMLTRSEAAILQSEAPRGH